MGKFQIVTDLTCVLCKSENEMHELLFFGCAYSAYIWQRCRFKLGLQPRRHCTRQSEISEFLRLYKGENQIAELASLVFNAAFWFIWKEGNDRIFSNSQMHKTKLFQMLEQHIQLRMSLSLKYSSDLNSKVAILHNWYCHLRIKCGRSETVKWLPIADWIKINSDGFLNSSAAGFASIIRDQNVVPIGVSHSSCPID